MSEEAPNYGAPGVAALAHESRSSIELKRNAKGEYAWDVYFEDEDEGEALGRLQMIDGLLRAKYLDGGQEETMRRAYEMARSELASTLPV